MDFKSFILIPFSRRQAFLIKSLNLSSSTVYLVLLVFFEYLHLCRCLVIMKWTEIMKLLCIACVLNLYNLCLNIIHLLSLANLFCHWEWLSWRCSSLVHFWRNVYIFFSALISRHSIVRQTNNYAFTWEFNHASVIVYWDIFLR